MGGELSLFITIDTSFMANKRVPLSPTLLRGVGGAGGWSILIERDRYSGKASLVEDMMGHICGKVTVSLGNRGEIIEILLNKD